MIEDDGSTVPAADPAGAAADPPAVEHDRAEPAGGGEGKRFESDEPYVPIDCSVHDRLEALAVKRRPCVIRYTRGRSDDAVVEVRGRIVDIGADGGVEYLTTDGGVRVRLDRLRSVTESA